LFARRSDLVCSSLQVIIQINNDYLAELNERKKAEAEKQRQLNEVSMSDEVEDIEDIEAVEDNDLPFEPEPEPEPTPKPKLEIVKLKKQPKSKKQQQLEAQAFLQANPEFAQDIDQELGLSEIPNEESLA
jgi:type IV secretory pathway VirB10-like protein